MGILFYSVNPEIELIIFFRELDMKSHYVFKFIISVVPFWPSAIAVFS